jgi:predicted phage-related endonuclease
MFPVEDAPPGDIGSIIELTDRLSALRKVKRDIEAEEESVRKQLLDHFDATGEHQVFTASGQVAATLRESVRTSINRAKLEAVYPEVYADVITASRVRQIWLP